MKRPEEEMRDEYDFSRMAGGVRGKHAARKVRILGATHTPPQPRRDTLPALPCPFCGASNVVTTDDECTEAGGCRATCQACGASGPLQPSEREARLSWNRREAA